MSCASVCLTFFKIIYSFSGTYTQKTLFFVSKSAKAARPALSLADNCQGVKITLYDAQGLRWGSGWLWPRGALIGQTNGLYRFAESPTGVLGERWV